MFSREPSKKEGHINFETLDEHNCRNGGAIVVGGERYLDEITTLVFNHGNVSKDHSGSVTENLTESVTENPTGSDTESPTGSDI